jgi:large subunit ribosomal protein L5
MYVPRLKKKYLESVIPQLKDKLGLSSVMQVPRLKKININQGVGGAVSNSKLIEGSIEELTLITGQRAIATRSKKSISNFKLRQGMKIGVMVTLRGNRMYEFLDRLVNISMPRIRDFKGVSRSMFDGRGNYTLGIKEQIIFPEISIHKVNKVTGMNVTFVTDVKDDGKAYELLKALGMPFNN